MAKHPIIIHPWITEKTMAATELENKIEFVVSRSATKAEIKRTVEKLLAAKVVKVNTKIMKDGKHAIVKFAKEYSAEELASRLGAF